MPYSYNKHRHHEQPDQYPANETQIRYSNLKQVCDVAIIIQCCELQIAKNSAVFEFLYATML